MSRAELEHEVRTRALLPGDPKPETLDEWWEYAERRGLTSDTDEAGRRRITDSGRTELEQRAAEWRGRTGLDTLRASLGWLLPSSAVLVSAATIALNGDETVVVALAGLLLFIAALVPLLWLGDRFLEAIDPPILRKAESDAIAFLDGEPLRVGLRRERLDRVDPVRLYGSRPAPALEPGPEPEADDAEDSPRDG